ncbi:MAG: glycoside hydrolase family 97 protein [Verrucomicrobiota bacterium]|jgi:alpha-glucosidase
MNRLPTHATRLAALGLLLLAGATASAQHAITSGRTSVKSPDGAIECSIQADGPLTYSVSVDGAPILLNSKLGLKFQDGTALGAYSLLVKTEREESDTTRVDRLGKRREVRDHHNELRVSLGEATARNRPFQIIVRAFNDGLAFRYVLPALPPPPVQNPLLSAPAAAVNQDFVLVEEQTQFSFPGNYPCFAGENENTGTSSNLVGFVGSQEMNFLPTTLARLPTNTVRGAPLLVRTPAAYVNLAESDLRDWAGMWFSRIETPRRSGVTVAARLSPRPDGNGLVKSAFPRHSPWRVLMIARQPGQLIESDLINNLASPCELADISWVKPGMMAWDHWWSGIGQASTEGYETFIQFAADMGWPYQLMDGGWASDTDATTPSAGVDLPAILQFARARNVRLWVWSHWTTMHRDENYLEAFPLYQRWGLAGVKIDFMNRDDQDMVNWYEKITKSAAEHHLMVDFHGAFKPAGMIRTFPNQITREGILGNEYNKWSARVTPEHKVTLPFTRLALGPGDFTPGGFLNTPPAQFQPVQQTGGAAAGRGPAPTATEVQGTRCAELALFVCFDSPVCCVCDHPSHIKDQPGADFLKIVPTVWDDTKVLDGDVGRHLVMVRRSGQDWFLGALTDRSRRNISVKLDFLKPGKWKMSLWKDAADAKTQAQHLDLEERIVTAGGKLKLSLAPAGGAVARFEPAAGN